MPLNKGRNTNTNDVATIPAGIVLNATTTVIIAAANPDRISFFVDNNSSVKQVWVKLQPASTDNDKKGIFLSARNDLGGSTQWSMDTDNIYTGEISAIADSGNPIVYITEY